MSSTNNNRESDNLNRTESTIIDITLLKIDPFNHETGIANNIMKEQIKTAVERDISGILLGYDSKKDTQIMLPQDKNGEKHRDIQPLDIPLKLCTEYASGSHNSINTLLLKNCCKINHKCDTIQLRNASRKQFCIYIDDASKII